MSSKKTGLMLTIASIFFLVIAGFTVYKLFLQPEKMQVIGEAPEFSMTNIDGDLVTFQDVDKVKLVYFFFSSCADECPVSTQTMNKVQEKLKSEGVFGQKAELFSITVDPKRDTLPVLTAYAEQFDADLEGWNFLRSETPAEAKQVSESFGGGVINEGEEIMHADLLFLVDPDNKLRKYYLEQDVDEIVSDMIRLTKE